MAFNFNMSFGRPKPSQVERYSNGDTWYTIGQIDSLSGKICAMRDRVSFALSNESFMSNALKVTRLGSQARFHSANTKGEIISTYALHDLMPRANAFQTWTEFISQVMLYANIGLAVIYIPNNTLSSTNTIHCLKLEKITYNAGALNKLGSIIGLNKGSEYLKQTRVNYTFEDGSTRSIPLNELHLISALPLGLSSNLFENITLVDVLYKVLINSNELLDLEYKTSKLAQKVIVGEKKGGVDLSLPQNEPEKQSIEKSVMSDKFITATNKDIQAKRLVESKSGLGIPEHYKLWSNVIGDMLGISPDLGIDAKSTYNNQELATGRTIEFAVMPILDKLVEILEQNSSLKNIQISFAHMGFNQVFEKEREEKNKLKLDNIISALDKNLITPQRAEELTKQIFD